MKVKYLYHPAAWIAREGDTLLQAERRMARHNVSALPVVNGDRLVGILTERDLARAIRDDAEPRTTKVRAYMTRSPATVTLEDESDAVARTMVRMGIRHLPVVRGDQVIGMISARDLLLIEAWVGSPRASSVPEWMSP
jgi:CBS domain-containing protein